MAYVCPEKIYKYLNVEGLIKTLEGGSLKFSRPSDFNDPMDIHLQDAFGMDDNIYFEGMKNAFYDFIISDTSLTHIKRLPHGEMSLEVMQLMGKSIKNSSIEKQESFKKKVLDTPIEDLYNIESLKNIRDELIQAISKSFSNDGVFCSTIDNNNLLMWAHYAEKHKGAIIELEPNLIKDSALLVSKPVQYSTVRPLLYRNPKDMVVHAFTMTQQESMEKILNGLVYTKSLDWAYEKEYRAYVPRLIPENESLYLLKFYPEELTSLYLGCKMEADIRAKVIFLAKRINKNINLYQAEIEKREYKLHYKKIV